VADNYQDIGSNTEIFPFDFNWATPPKRKVAIERYLHQKPATVDTLEEKTTETPMTFQGSVMLDSKQAYYNALDFIHNRIGKTQRFWVHHPAHFIDLKEATGLGGYVMTCIPNEFYLHVQGYERVYILTDSGDIISNKVIEATYDELAEEMVLTVNSPWDRAVEIDEYQVIGLLLLVRFDMNTFKLKMHNASLFQMDFTFHELVREYEDSDL